MQTVTVGATGPEVDQRAATTAIAFLGTGRMGGPMAANLARAGFGVRAWDRTASRAAALIVDGATVAASPAEAVKGARILITMLADGPATEQMWNGPDGLQAAGPGLIWAGRRADPCGPRLRRTSRHRALGVSRRWRPAGSRRRSRG